MSENVISLDGRRPPQLGEPSEALVKMLEDLTEHARSGLLQSFIGCGFTCDGLRATVWHDTHPNIYEMMGSISWLQHEYAHRHTQET
jgi:hypothetical protein